MALASRASQVARRPRCEHAPSYFLKSKLIPLSDGNGTGATPASHKLGPKSNQGAINAQLRALDRSGKPCKRWTKASITLKSFTGVQWSLPKWATPIVDKSLNVSEAPSTAPSVNGDEVRKDAPSAAPTEVGEPMSIVITPPEQTAPIATA